MTRTIQGTATLGEKAAIWLLLALAVAACGGGPGPETSQPTGPEPLFVRHWDQVCSASRDPVFLRIEELIDTVGLGSELRTAGALAADEAGNPEQLEMVLWYHQTGHLEAAARWDTNMVPERAAIAEEIMAARAQPLDQLLGRSSFYTVLSADPAEPRASIGRDRSCMPHMRHPDQGRAFGLPDTVTTWHGLRNSRRDTTVASVRLHIDRMGFPADVDSLEGPGWAIEAVRELVPQLRFDPALVNGRRVSGLLTQSFRFGR